MRLQSFFFIVIVLISFSFVSSFMSIENVGKTKQVEKRSTEWILELQDNFNNPQWFYDNLNDTERLMIRQALDLAIPRNYIKDNIFSGDVDLLANDPLVRSHSI